MKEPTTRSGILHNLGSILREASPFAAGTVKAGGTVMAGCFLCGQYALWLAPTARGYFVTMEMARGYFEAGPACLAASVVAAVLCDLIIKKDLN